MNKKGISKKDDLLKKIYFYKEISSEAIDVLNGSFYIEKVKKELLNEGLIKKSSLKNTKKTALKAGATYKIQSYYVTSKGKKYLHEKFPDEFSEKILTTRKQSNDATERLVKIADSAIMSEIAGAYIVNKENLMEEDFIGKQKREPQYDDFGDIITPEIGKLLVDEDEFFTEENSEADDEQLKQIIEENLSRGIFLNANEAKKNLTLTKKETTQYKFTSITGVLLTSAKPYCLYHAGNGFISQTAGGENKIAKTLIYNYTRNFNLYPEEFLKAKISNAIFFCKNISAFAKLVLNKYNAKVKPGEIFDNSYIIPVSRNGCNIIKRFIEKPDYKERLLDYLISEYGFIKNQGYAGKAGYAVNALPVVTPNGEAVFIGIDFEVNSFRTAIEVATEESETQKIVVLCYAWQQDYYEEVINLLNTDKIICQPIDEEALDEIMGFTNRVPTIKERKRRKPTYSRNSLFKRNSELGTSGNEINETNKENVF